jgi:hypothetical protein
MAELIMIELFAGSKTMAQAFREQGHQALTIDNSALLEPDILADILELKVSDLPKEFRNPDVIWASPPCTAFSVCNISRNWKSGRPISEKARLGLKLLDKTISLIKELKPRYFFIENPRGMMRKYNSFGHRVTQTYCQWGMKYQKPTDIWTNSTWQGRKPCKAGDRCHQYQPRTYKSKVGCGVLGLGVQGLKNAYERGKLPKELCKDIVRYCEGKREQQTLATR